MDAFGLVPLWLCVLQRGEGVVYYRGLVVPVQELRRLASRVQRKTEWIRPTWEATPADG